METNNVFQFDGSVPNDVQCGIFDLLDTIPSSVVANQKTLDARDKLAAILAAAFKSKPLATEKVTLTDLVIVLQKRDPMTCNVRLLGIASKVLEGVEKLLRHRPSPSRDNPSVEWAWKYLAEVVADALKESPARADGGGGA